MSTTLGLLALEGRQAGSMSVDVTADVTLTTEQASKKFLVLTGAPTATVTVTFPLASDDRGYSVTVANTSGKTVRLKATGTVGCILANADVRTVLYDGSDVCLNAFSTINRRFALKWTAGQRGKPCINADMASGTEATREVADPDFEVLGTNGTSALSTFNAEGGIKFTTAGADNDQMILAPHLDTNQTAWANVTWGSDQETEWEAHLKTGSAVTAQMVWAGLKLTNTSTTATDDDQAFFRYQNGVNSGKWQVLYSIGGTDTAVDSGVTVAADTEYHFRIAIDTARIARFYINGALVGTSTALTDAKDYIPYLGVQASGAAAAKHFIFFGQAISRKIA